MTGSITLASFFCVVVSAGIVTAGDRIAAAESRQGQGEGEEVAKLLADLALEGVEAKGKREGAVAGLLGMKSQAAHQALQEVLERDSDPDHCVRLVLDQLVPRLRNPRDPVFAPADRETVQKLRASYARPLILLVGRDGDLDPGVHGRAREALLALASWERLPAFRALLDEPDPALRTLTARAAGDSQDLSVARVLGDHLADGDPGVRDAVRLALQRLTFSRGTFASKEELEAWFEQSGGKSFVMLAEEAARRTQSDLQQQRQEFNDRERELVLELIRSFVDHSAIKWKEIEKRALSPDPAITTACLERLRDLLAKQETLTGAASDRLALFDKLMARLELARSGGSAQDQALLLEVCAYLVTSQEEARHGIVRLLLEGLGEADARVRRAALAGLVRFPSEENRRHVVEVARNALANNSVEVLGAALKVLQGKDWNAPRPTDESYEGWTTLLKDTLRRPSLDEVVLTAALDTLVKLDADKKRVAAAFEILVSVVQDKARRGEFRDSALLRLRGYLVDATLTERYVQLLVGYLSDESPAIRRRASDQIHELPEDVGTKEQLTEWTRELLEAAHGRLLIETEASIHDRLCSSMSRTADLRVPPDIVINYFCDAAKQLSGAPGDYPFRQQHVARELKTLAVDANRAPALWVRAGMALADLGDLVKLRAVLEEHREGLKNKQSVEAAVMRDAHYLTIRAALLREPGKSWKDDPEADQVLRAVDQLVANTQLPADPEITLLRMDIRGDLKENEKVLELAASIPANGDNTLNPRQRQRLALRVGRALLDLDRAAEARDRLLPFASGGTATPEVFDLLHSVAIAFMSPEHREFAAAAEIGKILVEQTPDDSKSAAARLLLYAEALYKVDPTTHKDQVEQLLDAKQNLFADVPNQVRKRYDDLRKAVAGS